MYTVIISAKLTWFKNLRLHFCKFAYLFFFLLYVYILSDKFYDQLSVLLSTSLFVINLLTFDISKENDLVLAVVGALDKVRS